MTEDLLNFMAILPSAASALIARVFHVRRESDSGDPANAREQASAKPLSANDQEISGACYFTGQWVHQPNKLSVDGSVVKAPDVIERYYDQFEIGLTQREDRDLGKHLAEVRDHHKDRFDPGLTDLEKSEFSDHFNSR